MSYYGRGEVTSDFVGLARARRQRDDVSVRHAYQLMAQQIRPDSFVLSIGYGECWPGYIPTESAFDDDFHDNWLWVAPGSESRLRTALEGVLRD